MCLPSRDDKGCSRCSHGCPVQWPLQRTTGTGVYILAELENHGAVIVFIGLPKVCTFTEQLGLKTAKKYLESVHLRCE